MKFATFILILLFGINAHATNHQRAPKKESAQEKAKKAAAAELNRIIDAIQKYYNNTKSAALSFEQNYNFPSFNINQSSKGKVYFKAKNMLWRYTEPADSQKEFYIAGKKFTYYRINDRVATTHDCFDQDTLSASITFLWGQGKLRDSFNITAYQGPTVNTALKWISLSPKEKGAPVKSIALGADAKSGVVKESIVVGPSGDINHYKFTKLNEAFSDKIFDFKPKKGVVVQPMPGVTCNAPPPAAPIPPKAKAKTPAVKGK